MFYYTSKTNQNWYEKKYLNVDLIIIKVANCKAFGALQAMVKNKWSKIVIIENNK